MKIATHVDDNQGLHVICLRCKAKPNHLCGICGGKGEADMDEGQVRIWGYEYVEIQRRREVKP